MGKLSISTSIVASPVHCGISAAYQCYCHYYLYFKANVYNCSSMNMESLPPSVPHGTDWLVMENDSRITQLSASYDYLYKLRYLDLHNNSIVEVTDTFWNNLLKNVNLTWLNLANNRIYGLSRKMEQLFLLKKIWLGGNPFHCDCSMICMIGWLNNFTTESGDHIIVDCKDVLCYSGLKVGTPIYKLDEVDMGCFPHKLTEADISSIVFGGVAVIMIVIIYFKRSLISFYLMEFFNLDFCPKDELDEKVDDMEYDAYLCYS